MKDGRAIIGRIDVVDEAKIIPVVPDPRGHDEFRRDMKGVLRIQAKNCLIR